MIARGLPVTTRRLALIVGCVFFMEQLDTTILSSALPVMSRTLHVAPASMNLALTAYLISQCIYIPASGWLADRFGTKTIFCTAIVVFGLGSLLCAAAQSLAALVVFRIVQGIGGSMMLPVGRLCLLRNATRAERLKAMSVVLIPGMIGPVLGPAVGGVIVTWLSWPWIFLINIPASLLALAMAWKYVPQFRRETARKFDWAGSMLLSTGLIAIICGLEILGQHGWNPEGAIMSGAGVLLGVLYWRHAGRHDSPLLDTGLLKTPTFGVAVYGGSLFRMAYGVVPFLLPMLLQIGFGMSPTRSGLLTSAGTIGGLFTKSIATGVFRLTGFRRAIIWNGVASVAFLLACAAFTADTPYFVLLIAIVAGGLIRSLQFNAYGSLAYADLELPQMSMATSFHDTVQQMSVSLGVSIGALTLSSALWFSGHTPPQRGDFSIAFAGAALFAGLAVLPCLRLAHDAGSSLLDRSDAPAGGIGALSPSSEPSRSA